MHIHKFTRNILFTLFVIYFAQGSLYETGTLMSQASLALILVISGAYFVISFLGHAKLSPFCKAWSLLLFLNSLGFILTLDFNTSNVIMFKNILVCMLSFYPFYFYAQKDLLGSKQFLWFFIFLLPITILQFHKLDQLLVSIYDKEDVVNNITYMFVSLIPFVFLFKKNKFISGVFLGVILFYVILGNKRGAMITAGLGTAIYAYYQLRTIDKRKRLRSYLIALSLIVGLGYFTYYNYVNNDYLIQRMGLISTGNYSGREYIYAKIFDSWFNSDSAWNYLFGFGFGGAHLLTGRPAHSDWLELLANFGLLGVGVYLYLFSTTIKYVRNKDWESDKRLLMLAITAMWFATSVYSMWYSAMAMSLQVIILAYLIGSKKSNIG